MGADEDAPMPNAGLRFSMNISWRRFIGTTFVLAFGARSLNSLAAKPSNLERRRKAKDVIGNRRST
jgi:hypothetical protein